MKFTAGDRIRVKKRHGDVYALIIAYDPVGFFGSPGYVWLSSDGVSINSIRVMEDVYDKV